MFLCLLSEVFNLPKNLLEILLRRRNFFFHPTSLSTFLERGSLSVAVPGWRNQLDSVSFTFRSAAL